mmetsp:Transcript_42695/g.84137  ORF Transcript_42695/g.84137 Transcript_42695/m.84137 type:complete len:80 (-) Transcript_42695:941-1180(-)
MPVSIEHPNVEDSYLVNLVTMKCSDSSTTPFVLVRRLLVLEISLNHPSCWVLIKNDFVLDRWQAACKSKMIKKISSDFF